MIGFLKKLPQFPNVSGLGSLLWRMLIITSESCLGVGEESPLSVSSFG